jgi:putative flippase GtrA
MPILKKRPLFYYGHAVVSGIDRDYLKLAKYFSVGIIATAIDWALFYVFIQYLQMFYLLALALSYILSTVLNYFMNRRYTFRNAYGKIHIQFASFATVAVLGMGLNEVLVYGMANYVLGITGPRLMASRAIATLIVFIWNFLINKSITFKIFQ